MGVCVPIGPIDSPWKEAYTMKIFLQKWFHFVRSDDGPTTTEYAVMLAVIAIAVLSSMSLFGVRMGNLYTTLAGTLSVF